MSAATAAVGGVSAFAELVPVVEALLCWQLQSVKRSMTVR
jgi:hypothetical protein